MLPPPPSLPQMRFMCSGNNHNSLDLVKSIQKYICINTLIKINTYTHIFALCLWFTNIDQNISIIRQCSYKLQRGGDWNWNCTVRKKVCTFCTFFLTVRQRLFSVMIWQDVTIPQGRRIKSCACVLSLRGFQHFSQTAELRSLQGWFSRCLLNVVSYEAWSVSPEIFNTFIFTCLITVIKQVKYYMNLHLNHTK